MLTLEKTGPDSKEYTDNTSRMRYEETEYTLCLKAYFPRAGEFLMFTGTKYQETGRTFLTGRFKYSKFMHILLTIAGIFFGGALTGSLISSLGNWTLFYFFLMVYGGLILFIFLIALFFTKVYKQTIINNLEHMRGYRLIRND